MMHWPRMAVEPQDAPFEDGIVLTSNTIVEADSSDLNWHEVSILDMVPPGTRSLVDYRDLLTETLRRGEMAGRWYIAIYTL